MAMRTPLSAAVVNLLLCVGPLSVSHAVAHGGQDKVVAGVLAEIDAARMHAVVTRLAKFGTRHTLSDTVSPTRGIGAARNWIKSEMETASRAGGGRLQVSFEEFEQPKTNRVPKAVQVVNVVGVLPGSMPEAASRRYYVVGHYDSRNTDAMDAAGDAPGANDDASGTAVVMELARVLADAKLDATVVFLATAGEEQGLLGASYHAAQAAARKEDIRGVLSNDIVGDPTGPADASGKPMSERARIRVFSEGVPRNPQAARLAEIRNHSAESDSPSRQLARFVAEAGSLQHTDVQAMLVFRPDRFLRGGDHSAFNDNGFPAVRFTTVYENYDRQHQNIVEKNGKPYGDVPEFVDAEYLADVARLNAAALIRLANAPSAPANARLLTKDLVTDTTIRWEASPEPDVAGYEVVWRETTSATWTDSKDVGAATEATLPLSKDNVFFGVRAYDRDGYRSPVVFPGSRRE
jgi:Zn-dependent M28 family amino/carboxypeptidase